MTLKYNRKGFLPGVPARDLTDEEVEKYGGEEFLLSRGIYERDEKNLKIDFRNGTISIDGVLVPKIEQQAPIERPKRETKKANPDRLAKDG